MTLHRRAFARQLQAAALAAALAPWSRVLSQAAPTARTWKTHPFALGVASGRPRPDAVVLWTRLLVADADRVGASGSDEPVRVTWAVYADEGLRQLVRQGEQVTDARRAHSVHVHVQGLQPGRTYWYRFTSGNATSTVGRTRTAPAPDAKVKQLRLALASCQHYEQGEYLAHQDIAQQSLDLVLFVGDYIYESSNPRYMVRKHQGGEPKTLSEYRDRYAQYKSDPLLQAAHAAHPWMLMWDDHEVVNDYANDLDQRYTDPAVFLQRRAAAYQAYFEHQPLLLGPDPDSAHRASMRLYDQMVWGQLAELWTLDCRQYRSHHACPDPLRGGGRVVTGCAELDEPQRTLLGMAQERWLTQGLTQSRRQWKLLGQATQLSSTAVNSPLGRAIYTDAWDGYPEARRRLLQTVADAGLTDVVTLGGDVHMNVAAKLRAQPNDDTSPVLASEFVATSITSRGLDETALSAIRANNPDIVHARSDERGYALLEVTPAGVRCEFRTTAFPASVRNTMGVQAVYQVLKGRAGPQAA